MFKDVNLKDQTVIIRVDFNVPFDENLKVSDDTRIKGAIPTIKDLLERRAKVVLLSHLGRPLKDLNIDGTTKAKYSLIHVVDSLKKNLDKEVIFIETPLTEPSIIDEINKSDRNKVILLENTRFYKGEEQGEIELAKNMASLGKYYVNDAFGAAHREHASTATIARFFNPEHKSFGFLMDKEVENISKILGDMRRPFCAIVGGAKVSDKIALIENLLDKVDKIIIGGGMAFTFIKAQGGAIGSSLCEVDKLDLALELITKAKNKNVEFILPVDSKVTQLFSNDGLSVECDIYKIQDNWMGLDLGENSIKLFEDAIMTSKTILWNGPMGVFEFPNFSKGTISIAKALARATDKGAFTLVGGGDSVAAITQAELDDDVSFVSTGGGAMLEMIEGKELPGVVAMNQMN